MIRLIPITYTKQKLYQAAKKKDKMIVPCRGEKVYFKNTYIDNSPRHQEDLIIREDFFLFGDNYDFTAEWMEHGRREIPEKITEHFPHCSKKGLIILLKETPDLFPPTEFIQGKIGNEKWITVKENFETLSDYVQALRRDLFNAYKEIQYSR